MEKFLVITTSFALIGGISWFFFGKKNKEEEKTQTGEAKQLELDISGMHCAGCATGIEATLKLLDGIKTASVNFATSKAIIEYDSSKIDKQAIIDKIRELGYDASLNLEEFEKKS